MPEAFLISTVQMMQPDGGETDPVGRVEEAFRQVLKLAGLGQKRVDAVYWGGEGSIRNGLAERGWKPVIAVDSGALSSQMAAHQASQALLTGDVDVALVGDGASVIVLASAKAVGMLNLLPRAGLIGRGIVVSPEENQAEAAVKAARRALAGTEEELGGIKRFSFAVPTKEVKAAWGEAFQAKPRHLINVKKNTTGITALVNLVESLEKNEVRLGLMVGTADGVVAAMLVERV